MSADFAEPDWVSPYVDAYDPTKQADPAGLVATHWPEFNDRLRTLLLEGWSLKEIADSLAIPSGTVSRLVREATGGLGMVAFLEAHGWVGRSVPPEQVEAVLAAFDADESALPSDIARALQISDAKVRLVLKAKGRDFDSPARREKRTEAVMRAATRSKQATLSAEEMVRRIRDGVPPSQVARQAGVSAGRVSQIVKKATGLSPTQVQQEAGARRNISPEQAQQARELWDRGMHNTAEAVADELGLPPHAVRSLLGNPKARARAGFDAAQREALEREARQGLTVGALAAKYRIDDSRIARLLDESKIPRRRRRKVSEEVDEAGVPLLLVAYQQGVSVAALAAEHRVSESTIRRHLSAMGVSFDHRVLSKEQEREILEARAAGVSRQTLADRYGVSQSTIRRVKPDPSSES